jgi:gamma-glutamyltranspeptidase/glutathione hydrolase
MVFRVRQSRLVVAGVVAALVTTLSGSSQPVRARHGMVVAEEPHAARVGLEVLREGGSAVDAAVATAFALAVTHPAAGNIGGGGFMLVRPVSGDPVVYDFREAAPAAADASMFLVDGEYDEDRHHNSHLAVGVPGTVAGLHLAWSERGQLPWQRLVEPSLALAREGFVVSDALARSLASALVRMRPYGASVAQFSKGGTPYEAGDTLRQTDLARTLQRIAEEGPDGFYGGDTAALIEREMATNGGLITREDLAAYRVVAREPVRSQYRGYDLLSTPPPSSGGTAVAQMLNVLEGYDLSQSGHGAANTVHVMVEAMRRAFADRARYLGDPEFNPTMPATRLRSKSYAETLRRSIDLDRASESSPSSFVWPSEGRQTTHLSVVDADRQAVSLTYTLEQRYGSGIVVSGAGFLLNNEMGDFNAAPGLTTADGLIGTTPNLAGPGKRMLSSMTPTIVVKDGKVFMLTGSPGGRTIINTVLHTIVNVIDFGMNIQEAVDAPRFHHQWLPDRILYERHGLSPDTIAILESRGHTLVPRARQGVVQAVRYDAESDVLEGAPDRRSPGSTALGY